jgi:two-component system cell cycle response regulator
MPILATKILLVEDNPGDARLLQEALAEIAEARFELIHRETLTQALNALAKSNPDVVLADLGLPDAKGLEAVVLLRGAAPNLPLVVLTGTDDENLAARALKAGAQDYLIKAQIDGRLLWRALSYSMERQRLHLELVNLSHTDDLTGFSNRRGFLALAEHQVKLAYRTGKPFLVGFVDLDGMKQINDMFGHQEGNRALVDTAGVLMDSFRRSDILARLGGDEFAVLIADATENDIEAVLDRIQQKLSSLNASPGRLYALSFSIGIVPGDTTRHSELEQLLSKADGLMYQQKHSKGASRKVAKSSC